MVETSFIDYEKSSNPVLLCLGQATFAGELSDIVSAGARLLTPATVSLEERKIVATAEFIRLHSAVFNPFNKYQFVTFGGLLGLVEPLEGDRAASSIFVFGRATSVPPPRDVSSLFSRESAAFHAAMQVPDTRRKNVMALREGVLSVSRSAVPFVVISDPLEFIPPTPAEPEPDSAAPIVSPKPRVAPPQLGSIGADSPPKPQQQVAQPPFHAQVQATSQVATLPVTSPMKAARLMLKQPRKNTFFAKLKQPEAAGVVKDINVFIRNFVKHKATKPMAEQASAMQKFSEEMRKTLAAHPLWQGCSEDEAEDIVEGVEKYLAIKLFNLIFPPCAAARGERRPEIEQDEHIRAKIQSLWFLERKHLDVQADSTPESERQMNLAKMELLKINDFKSPYDKSIILLNSCRIIFNLCSTIEKRACGADEFFPLLILVIVKANPPHLISNLEFVSCFRDPRRMFTEMSYFVTNFLSAVSFIREATAASLSIDREEFERLSKQPPTSNSASRDRSPSTGSNTSLPVDISRAPLRTPDSEHVSPISPGSLTFAPASCSSLDDLLLEPPSGSVPQSPRYRFFDMKPEDLKLGDIPTLLEEYKELVRLVTRGNSDK